MSLAIKTRADAQNNKRMTQRSGRRAHPERSRVTPVAEELFITTQPGWAFATLAELRARGIAGHVPFYHRDSSLILPGSPEALSRKLVTPAEVFGCLLRVDATATEDATAVLVKRLRPASLKEQVLAWLPKTQSGHLRRYSLATETYGKTSSRRQALSQTIDAAIIQAFPRWRRGGAKGLRILCKADPQTAVLGVQLYSNLSSKSDGQAGSLRPHLASGLLTLAGVGPGDTVLDPFMGTGTILNMAAGAFGAAKCIGLEIDQDAFDIAKRRLAGAELFHNRFQDFDASTLDKDTRLVSNIPFGVQFEAVPTATLVQFIRECEVRGARSTLLISRGQAKALAAEMNYRIKNVLVLGQPASILYSPSQSARHVTGDWT